MTNVINLTPHEVRVETLQQEAWSVFPPSGEVARVSTINTPTSQLLAVCAVCVGKGCGGCASPDGLVSWTIVCQEYGEVTGLPEPTPGTLYLVSGMVRQALPRRKDLVSPGSLVRDVGGWIRGCRNLIAN